MSRENSEMLNRRLNRLILLMVFCGLILTALINGSVNTARTARKEKLQEMQAAEAHEETAYVLSPEGPTASHQRINSGKYEEFLAKFQDTERTLNRMESGRERDGRTSSQAVSELRYWETQLNLLYSTIMAALPEEEAVSLAREQQEWRKERERTAAEAAKNESVVQGQSREYTLSQARSTRDRAYELLEQYKDWL